MKKLLFTWILLTISGVAFGSDTITRDMIRQGTDFSTMRCGRERVRMQDFMHEVRSKCGDPALETRIQGEPYPIWVYRFGRSDNVYLVVFGDQRVRRIHMTRCPVSGSGCQLGI